MSDTPSVMLPLQTQLPDFSFEDVVSGQTITQDIAEGKKALLVMFICVHCPFVKNVKEEIARIGIDFRESELAIVAVSSNDPTEHPQDAPDGMKEMALDLGLTFPFCYDQSQEAAKSFHAVCTPDFFLFDQNKKLVYRGQLDDSRPGNGIEPSGKDLRAAIEAVLNDQKVNPAQKPSIGCSIKWKPGNEPS